MLNVLTQIYKIRKLFRFGFLVLNLLLEISGKYLQMMYFYPTFNLFQMQKRRANERKLSLGKTIQSVPSDMQMKTSIPVTQSSYSFLDIMGKCNFLIKYFPFLCQQFVRNNNVFRNCVGGFHDLRLCGLEVENKRANQTIGSPLGKNSI